MADDMNLYEYAVIRYVPRVEREEFINVGLVMMCKRRRWLRIEVKPDQRKLSVYDCPHSTEEIERQLSAFLKVGTGAKDAGLIAALPVEERFRWLTAVKSSCLSTSRPHPGKTADLDATFARLWSELVE